MKKLHPNTYGQCFFFHTGGVTAPDKNAIATIFLKILSKSGFSGSSEYFNGQRESLPNIFVASLVVSLSERRKPDFLFWQNIEASLAEEARRSGLCYLFKEYAQKSSMNKEYSYCGYLFFGKDSTAQMVSAQG